MVLKEERKGLEKKFYEIALEITKNEGYVLYDLDYIVGSKTLRVYIMNKETGTAVIEDCVKIDHAFTPYMEDVDWVPDEIVLEVSSPGLFRNLTQVEHFEWAKGMPVQLQLKTTIGELLAGEELDKKVSKARKFVGVVEEVNDEAIVVELDENYSLQIKYTDIKKANLEPEVQNKAR